MLCYESIVESVVACYPELTPEDIQFGTPPSLEMGDVAIPAFSLAKKRRLAPHLMAQEMAQRVSFGDCIARAAASGPYLNLTFDRKRIGFDMLQAVLSAGDSWGSNKSGCGQRVLIEHTSINPNASPHIGRGRCAMIGDSLARLMRFEGYEVEVHYYVNDMGKQIGLLVLVASELEGVTFDRMLDIYVDANQRAKDDPDFAARGYELLSKMEEGDPETKEKFHRVTELCLRGQLDVLRRLNVSYDCFDHESVYVKDARWPAIEKALEERGAIFTDEEGRRVVDLSRLGYGAEEGRFFVLRRANGSSMYGCRDLLYSLDKHECNADINIMVLGEDHKLYAQQLALILNAAGIPAPEVIYYSYIRLAQGVMSTREGNVVLLSDFLDQASAISLEHITKQFPDLPEEDRRSIADQVAVSAIRFTVLRVRPAKNVIFDMETALSFTGDTGPYMLYGCARIRSILRKWGKTIPELSPESFKVVTDQEWVLLKTMAQFPKVVSDSMAQHTCAPIANFALDLAHAFTAFYHDCPVLNADDETLIPVRLHLCEAVLQTLSNALGILGIDTPERM